MVEAVSLVRELFGVFVIALIAVAHAMPDSTWRSGVAIEHAVIIRQVGGVYELAMGGTGPDYGAILHNGDIVLLLSSS